MDDSRPAISSATGVLPAPPAVTLPTQMTGTGTWRGGGPNPCFMAAPAP
jgi:hypothetical protein